jgi:hypothetical protein
VSHLDFHGRPLDCRRHSHSALPLGLGAIVVAFAWAYEKTDGGTIPADRPAAPPKVVTVTRTVTRVVNAHPLVSGTDIVLIVLIAAVVAIVLGGALIRRFL